MSEPTYVWVAEEYLRYEPGIVYGIAASAEVAKRLFPSSVIAPPSAWKCIDPTTDEWECGDLYVTRFEVETDV